MVANLIDPVTRAQAPLIGTALNLMAVAIFFAVDGHHMLVRAVAFSLEHFPPGRSLRELNLAAVAAQFGVMFTFGLALAAPATTCSARSSSPRPSSPPSASSWTSSSR